VKLTTAELVIWLLENYTDSFQEALRLMGFKEGEFSGNRNKAD